MRRTRWVGVVVTAAFLAVTVGPAMAKGEINHVTIDGHGLDESLVVRESQFLDDLAMAALEAVDDAAFPPAWVEEAYLVTRGYEEDGQAFPFDQVLYVPDPQGGKAFVYYIGIYNGEGPYDRNWYHATTNGQKTMETILRQARAAQALAASATAERIQPEVASTAAMASVGQASSLQPTASGEKSLSMSQMTLLGLVLVAAGFGAGWLLRQPRVSWEPRQE